jgi:AcrR family transcriptional regulator
LTKIRYCFIITMLYNVVIIIRSIVMPPKKQINKHLIIEKAFEMVKNEGYQSLTTRKLAKELNCSTQPIYQAFADMKELRLELIKMAQEKMYHFIIDKIDTTMPIELAYILAYIKFALEEKYLFQLIFTSGGLDLSALKQDALSIKLDINMIVYANGIIMMLAFNSLEPSNEKIKDMVTHAYELFKSDK